MVEPIIYPSKVLILGEYAALRGGESVAVPWSYFTGNWSTEGENPEFQDILENFIEYLRESNEEDELFLDVWEDDLEKGIYFKSDIPNGFGIGSSGAFVAAVFERYAVDLDFNLDELRTIFVHMESFFHGTSSGIDPLVSFLKQGIIMNKGKVQLFDYDDISILSHVFLWDTGIARKTGPLVEWYREQLKDATFSEQIDAHFIPANARAMGALMEDNHDQWLTSIQEISKFQRSYFHPMIPEEIQADWDYIASKEDIGIKLCGAGGGGFYLLYAKDVSKIQAIQEKISGRIIPYMY